ncbi:MAG: hypothetical protein PHP35_01830 [Candidatus Colwellbacteria bacterium]|nr:hypothetical protein [Candidatus Colwellbacteria bacterium]
MKKFLYWAPRVLSVLFIGFISLFSLDVFGSYSGWETVLALLIHLIPSFILVGVVILSWKRDLVGSISFLFLSLYYVWMVGFDRPWSWYAAISGPTLVISLLFFAHWMVSKGRRANSKK